jgi:hypothetical protein
LAADEGCEALIQNLLGPTLRALSDEEDNGDDDDTDEQAEDATRVAASRTTPTDEPAVEYDEDGRPRRPRRRGSAARPYTTPRKRLKIQPHEATANVVPNNSNNNNNNDPDWEPIEEETHPPCLYDFCLTSMDADLPALKLPYVRISGDATVATLLRFIQNKLAIHHVPLVILAGRTGRGRRQTVHVDTRLSSVGTVTRGLYYRRASKQQAEPKKKMRHVAKPAALAATVPAALVGEW